MDIEQLVKSFSLDALAKYYAEHEPAMWELCTPRKIIPPHGYPSTLALSSMCMSSLHSSASLTSRQKALVASTKMMAIRLLEYRLPAFFVADGLAEALLATGLPDNMAFTDLRWPLDAMAFIFSRKFSLRAFGSNVQFVNIARVPKGTYPRDARRTLDIGKIPFVIDNDRDRVIMSLMLLSPGNALPHDLDYTCPIETQVSNADTVATDNRLLSVEERDTFPVLSELEAELDMSPERELELRRKAWAMAIKLVAVLGVRPDLVRHGVLEKRVRAKSRDSTSRSKVELWSPNMIGCGYRSAHMTMTSVATGSGKRAHWRRGHIRHQPHGQQKAYRFPRVGATVDGITLSGVAGDHAMLAIHGVPMPGTARVIAVKDDGHVTVAYRDHAPVWIEPVLVNAGKLVDASSS